VLEGENHLRKKGEEKGYETPLNLFLAERGGNGGDTSSSLLTSVRGKKEGKRKERGKKFKAIAFIYALVF